jgi:serine/threonine protein kinase/predicted ATPase
LNTDAPTAIGPYRILEALGHGGMGVVYRGRHHRTGEVVAVKTVRAPNESLLRSLRREIHALARIRHPGIVQIVDEGTQDGLPWYAMELLEGRPLSLHVAGRRAAMAGSLQASVASSGTAATQDPEVLSPGWWTQSRLSSERDPREEAGDSVRSGQGSTPAAVRAGSGSVLDSGPWIEGLTLVRRLCAPLAFLHGEGIVHRDLKPENILIRPDGMPVIVDFGLLARFGGAASRESLEIAGAAVGTVAYMAPEQIRGELVDARADLYALGCILYELITGRPPFVGATAEELYAAHLEGEVVPPSALVAEAPSRLDALVLRLLAKRPRERLGHADDVAAALAGLGAEDGLSAAGPKPRAYLYRPGLAGRTEPIQELQRQLARLAAGTGGLVLVGGESGAGKTRLAMEAAREARLRRIRVLTAESLPLGGSPDPEKGGGSEPLRALRQLLQAIADRCREHGLAETERLLGRRGRLLALYEPSLAGLPGQEAHPEPAELPADAARVRLFTYVAETLAALAEDAPLLLLLDDLHWADELTLGFLEFVQRTGRFQRMRVLFLGAYRSEEVGEALQKLLEAPGAERIALGRLDQVAVGSMVGDMLALSPPPALFGGFLARHSEGNPFFVAEYLRTAIEEKLLYRNEAGQWHVAVEGKDEAAEALYETLPLPRSLRELVGKRLEGLSSRARGLAETGAVLGRDFDEVSLAGVLGMEGVKLMEAVQELLDRQVLEELPEGRLRFVHDQLREVAYEKIETRRRQDLHRAAAEALEAQPGVDRVETRAALGHHWERAGERAKAAGWYLAAARQARERFLLGEASRFYRACLALGAGPSEASVEAHNELGNAILRLRGAGPEVIAEHTRALEEARFLEDRAAEGQSLFRLGVVHQETGQLEPAQSFFEQALAVARATGDRPAEGRILSSLATVRQVQGLLDETRALHEQALLIHREVGNRKEEGATLSNLAVIRSEQGRLGEAHALYEQALALHREAGDRRSEGRTLNNLANLFRALGRPDEALPRYEQALALARQIGDRWSEGLTLSNLAPLYDDLGRSEQALALYEQALALHREIGNRQFEALDLSNLALLRANQGRLHEARSLSEQAVAILRSVGARWTEARLLVWTVPVERWSGDFAASERRLDQIEPVFAEVEDRLNLAACRCERGHLALVGGRSGWDFLEQAEQIAAAAQVGSQSELAKALARLRGAIEAAESGKLLFRGERIEDIPAGIRRWLTESGQLPA